MPLLRSDRALFWLTALLGVVMDQASKALVVVALEGHPAVHVVGNALTFALSRNRGAAFSFAPAATLFFTVIAAAAAVTISRAATRPRSATWAVVLGLLLAGAVGNLLDRLVRAPGIGRGAVVDFIDLQHFATFNIADSCLTCGVAMALLLALRGAAAGGEPSAPRHTPSLPGNRRA